VQPKAAAPAATMLAAVARDIPAAALEIASVPAPMVEADDDLVVRVEACGICGTDLHIMAGESYRPVTPFVLGHEPVGTVVAAGDTAREWLGRRIAITLFTGCGRCAWCLNGDERLCPVLVSITGVLGVWGGYAEYMRVHARQALEVPDTLGTLEAASLVDCGATAANSVRVALERGPGRVLVLGAGPIGFMCAELLRVSDVPVQVVQPSPLRREALQKVGHDVVASIDDAALPADVVIDCAGTPAVVAAGVRALAPRGMYLLAGYSRVPEMDLAAVARKEATLRGIRSGHRSDLAWITGLAAAGAIRLPEISAWSLSEANAALAALRDRRVPGKAVIVPDALWTERPA
jgi:2-desacetyl-2-hydroxyethyl bacteriochlorophyllide A dehydrogenase